MLCLLSFFSLINVSNVTDDRENEFPLSQVSEISVLDSEFYNQTSPFFAKFMWVML